MFLTLFAKKILAKISEFTVFTDFIQDVLKTLVACITSPKQALSVCLCKVKGDLHVGANFAK